MFRTLRKAAISQELMAHFHQTGHGEDEMARSPSIPPGPTSAALVHLTLHLTPCLPKPPLNLYAGLGPSL